MSDPVKDAWSEVADGFGKLGGVMKDRYQGEASDGPPADAGVPAAGEVDQGLREAFERLVAAGREVGQRAIDLVRDEEVNAQARRAAVSLNDALSATVDMIGREVEGLFGRKPSAPTTETEQATIETEQATIAAGGEPTDVADDGAPEVEGPNSL
jgi:hypothetical protein